MQITPRELLHLVDCVQQLTHAANSEIIAALSDERFEVRNIAMILAARRGIQVVSDHVTP